MNTYSQLFKQRETIWFDRIKPFLPAANSKILKIGNGFGHLSEMIREHTPDTTILDIATFDETINKERVVIYGGDTLPFADKKFDVCIMNLTLHHVKNSKKYLKDEIARTTKKRIILIEETYDNIFQKIHLVFRDWFLNIKAGQPCPIHWCSYFSRTDIDTFVRENNMKLVHRFTIKHHSYFKELIVIDLP